MNGKLKAAQGWKDGSSNCFRLPGTVRPHVCKHYLAPNYPGQIGGAFTHKNGNSTPTVKLKTGRSQWKLMLKAC